MSSFLQLALILAVILFVAKLAAYLSTRLGQPAVLGELIAGLLLGPTLLNVIHLPFVTDSNLLQDTLDDLGQMGVLLLMFMAGMELHPREMLHGSRTSATAALMGVAFSVGIGFLAGKVFSLSTMQAIFLGLGIGATSVSISAQTLMELDVLRSKVGTTLLGAAVFDDIIVLLSFSAYLAIISGNSGVARIGTIGLQILVFLVLAIPFGLWLLPKISQLVAKLSISQGVTTLAIVILLVYGIGAELLGNLAAILGAFLAGLMFSRTTEKPVLENNLRTLAYAFFVPIFFISVGLDMDLRQMTWAALGLLLALCVAAAIGKITGVSLAARLNKFQWREALQLGTGMLARGEVTLILAKIGLDQKLLNGNTFSALIGVVVLTTLITPIALRGLYATPTPVEPVLDQPPNQEVK
ncbi:MAG TPA: cation:proton antiporter [Longilinea sp.]|nr:cation:proton antiporter [Longilinea sp.]